MGRAIKRVPLALAACLLWLLPYAACAQTTQAPTTIEAPKLQVPIPDLSFSDAIVRDGSVTIPFLAQYIGGIYKFMIGIIGMVAAVMLVIGGFEYMTSAGDSGKVGAAKKRMVDALIGVVLAFGSYLMLYTINPNLVTFQSLQLVSVSTETYDTKAFFAAMNSSDINVNAQAQATVPQPSPDVHVTVPDGCPIPDLGSTRPQDMASHPTFVDRVQANAGGFIKDGTMREKLMQIAYTAAACKVPLGNCGRTVGTLTALAGSGRNPGCIKGGTESCVDNRGKEIHGPRTKEQRFILYAQRCAVEGSSKWPDCAFAGCTKDRCIWSAAQNSPSTHCRRLDCIPGDGYGAPAIEARNKIRDYMVAESNAGRLDAGWPDAWVDALVPGDWVVLYNGNQDLVGSHSVMFASPGKNGYINVVQGSPGDITRNTRWCVKKQCGDGMYPILEVYAPQ